MEKEFLEKISTKHFKCFFNRFKDVNFNIEKNVKRFIHESKQLFFHNKCFFKRLFKHIKNLPKSNEEVDPKILKQLTPFANYINKRNDENIRKFYKKVKNDPSFRILDDKFKLLQSEENYNNLIAYFGNELKWLRRKNGDTFTFMLSDDNLLPMYNSELDINNYESYISGKIILSDEVSYKSMNLALQHGYYEININNSTYISEHLGVSATVKEQYEEYGFTVLGFVVVAALFYFASIFVSAGSAVFLVTTSYILLAIGAIVFIFFIVYLVDHS